MIAGHFHDSTASWYRQEVATAASEESGRARLIGRGPFMARGVFLKNLSDQYVGFFVNVGACGA